MKVLDLFSGIGGFSLGLERAQMETVAFCESDPYCQKVLKKHWPHTPIFDDVKKLRKKDLPDDIDLICGGFPCTNISVAGKKEGIDGSQSGLWKEFYRLIKEIYPRWVIIENVANLRSLGLARVIKDLWKIGYECEWHIISARSVGACHLRERVWIIAYVTNTASEGLERSDEHPGRRKAISKKGKSESESVCFDREDKPTDANVPRLWKSFATEKEKSEWWTEATASFSDWRETESEFCRVDDGLPHRLDKDRKSRIMALGNSVVPFIPELIGELIMRYEND